MTTSKEEYPEDLYDKTERLEAEVQVLAQTLKVYRDAMEGFADSVRQDTGKAYPWPALSTIRPIANGLIEIYEKRGVI